MIRLTVHTVLDCSRIGRLSIHKSIDCTLKIVWSWIIWLYMRNVCYVMFVYFIGFQDVSCFIKKCFVIAYYEHSCSLRLFRGELQWWPPPMLERAASVALEYSGVSCIYVSKMAQLIMMYPSGFICNMLNMLKVFMMFQFASNHDISYIICHDHAS